ncbi:MAG: hypothetical protein AAFQ94_27860 [Bacteroidota bacterium]
MIVKAFQLEWLKVRHYRVFWVLLGLYLLSLIVLTSGGAVFLEFLKYRGLKWEGIDPTIIPIYDFPDVWHNNAWLGHFTKIFLAFIVVISVTNDWTFHTMRQNIIDGISKKEFILSKIILIAFLGAISTVFLFVTSFLIALVYSHTHAVSDMFSNLEFLFLYFVDIFKYCTFALFMTIIMRRPGFVIVFLIFYSLIIEPIVGAILKFNPNINEVTGWIEPWLPSNYFSITSGLIEVPFPRYFLQEVQEGILWYPLFIAIVWSAVFILLSARRLIKNDVR